MRGIKAKRFASSGFVLQEINQRNYSSTLKGARRETPARRCGKGNAAIKGFFLVVYAGRRRKATRRRGVSRLNNAPPISSARQLTRAEKETQTEAERLTMQIDAALHAVSHPTRTDESELEACAARLERAARDLAVALRELARERRSQSSDK